MAKLLLSLDPDDPTGALQSVDYHALRCGQYAWLRAFVEGHEGGVTALQLLGAGRLVSASRDGTLKIWRTASGAAEKTLSAQSGGVSGLAIAKSGAMVTGGTDGSVCAWRPAGAAAPAAPPPAAPEASRVSASVEAIVALAEKHRAAGSGGALLPPLPSPPLFLPARTPAADDFAARAGVAPDRKSVV